MSTEIDAFPWWQAVTQDGSDRRTFQANLDLVMVLESRDPEPILEKTFYYSVRNGMIAIHGRKLIKLISISRLALEGFGLELFYSMVEELWE